MNSYSLSFFQIRSRLSIDVYTTDTYTRTPIDRRLPRPTHLPVLILSS